MENEILEIKKANKLNRILLIVVLVMVTLMFAMCIAVGVFAYSGYREIMPYIDQIKTFDFNQINEVCKKLNSIDYKELTETLKNLEKEISVAAEALASLEETVEGIKGAFSGLFGF